MKRSSVVAAPTANSQNGRSLLDHLDEALCRIQKEDDVIRQIQNNSAADKSLRLLRVLAETVIEQREQGRSR